MHWGSIPWTRYRENTSWGRAFRATLSELSYLLTSCAFPRPFFDKVTIALPGVPKPLVISAAGASSNQYVQSLSINGRATQDPVITHAEIVHGGEVLFEMSAQMEAWGSSTLVS